AGPPVHVVTAGGAGGSSYVRSYTNCVVWLTQRVVIASCRKPVVVHSDDVCAAAGVATLATATATASARAFRGMSSRRFRVRRFVRARPVLVYCNPYCFNIDTTPVLFQCQRVFG